MNEEMKQGDRKPTFWEEVKKFCSNPLRVSYVFVSMAIILFFIAQFVPIAKGHVLTENSNLFELLKDESKYTVFSFLKKTDGNIGAVLYWVPLIPLILSIGSIIAFFLSKGKEYGKKSFGWSIVGLIFSMLIYLFCYIAIDEYEYTTTLETGNTFYCITAVVLFFSLINACRCVKKAKEEEKIQARVKEELKKEKEKEQK